MADGTKALAAVMQGKKVGDAAARSGLEEAAGKITRLKKAADTMKEHAVAAGMDIVHSAEIQGSVFLASMAEGYFGADKLKWGGIDVRAPLGIAGIGYGVYETLTGESNGHALAFGNGVFASWMANLGVKAGQVVKEKMAEKAAGIPAAAAVPQISGPVRQVELSPPSVPAVEVGHRRGSRFVPVSVHAQ